MQTRIDMEGKLRLRKPIMIVGLPGIGNVGRVAAGYMISELKMKKFAELHSPYFLHLVILDSDNVAKPLKCDFYYTKGNANDIVVLTGDTQSITTEGHYEFCEKVFDFAKKLGVRDIITMGGFAEEKPESGSRVIGAASSKDVRKRYEKYKVNFGKDHPVGTIVGASGLLIGMAEKYGMSGLILMGETMPMLYFDPKAADNVLHVLIRILNIKLDLGKLERTVKEMEERFKKTEEIHNKLLQNIPKSKDDIRYIG